MAYEELKSRIKDTPISLVIGNYLPLNKKGANLEALCPFHPDTKPSLKVNDAKGMYKCFVCGHGGDAITFVKDFKRLEYVETLKELASLLGLPFEEAQKEKKKNPKVEMSFRVLNASLKLYQKVSELGKKEFEEFLEKRKLTPQSVEQFQICYAPHGNALYQYLQSIPEKEREFALSCAKEIGIIKYQAERQSHYDFFRDRVMFPIVDHSGQIRGYTGRAVLPDQNPKYLNSGESIAFDKGSILYGFYQGKTAIRQKDQVVIVEGNMDAVMMHQHGFNETVATMGVALSENSVRLLTNMTKNIFLAMDSDNAGKAAMKKINASFLTQNVLPKYLSFDPHKDPDEFLVHEGRLSLMERMEKAPLYLDVLIQELLPEKLPETLDHKLKILTKAFEFVAPLKDHLSATERVISLAKLLGLKSDSSSIIDQYKDFLSKQKEKTYAPLTKTKLYQEEVVSEEKEELQHLQSSGQIQEKAPSRLEISFLKQIISHPELISTVHSDECLATVGHSEVKRILAWLCDIYPEIDESEYVTIVQDEILGKGFGDDITNAVTSALFEMGAPYPEKVIKKTIQDFKLNLKRERLKDKRRDLVERQKTSQTQLEVDEVLNEIARVDKEILALK